MKRFLLFAAITVVCMFLLHDKQAHAQTLGTGVRYSYCEYEALTQPSPNDGGANMNPGSGALSSTTGFGMRLFGTRGYRVTVSTIDAGATLAGAGTVDIYYWSAMPGMPSQWNYNKQLQETVSVGATSCAGAPCPSQTFGDHVVSAATDGWIEPVLNGLTQTCTAGACVLPDGGNGALVCVEAWSTN